MYAETALTLPAEAFAMPEAAPDGLVNLPERAGLGEGGTSEGGAGVGRAERRGSGLLADWERLLGDTPYVQHIRQEFAPLLAA
jgi:hypothetical protein